MRPSLHREFHLGRLAMIRAGYLNARRFELAEANWERAALTKVAYRQPVAFDWPFDDCTFGMRSPCWSNLFGPFYWRVQRDQV